MSREKASGHSLFSGWSVGAFFFRDLLLPLNIFVIVLMLLVGYSDHIDPREHAILSTLGLSFPFFLVLNGLFVVFWLVFNRRYILVPLIGFLVSWGAGASLLSRKHAQGLSQRCHKGVVV